MCRFVEDKKRKAEEEEADELEQAYKAQDKRQALLMAFERVYSEVQAKTKC
jgi:hypothetical protein